MEKGKSDFPPYCDMMSYFRCDYILHIILASFKSVIHFVINVTLCCLVSCSAPYVCHSAPQPSGGRGPNGHVSMWGDGKPTAGHILAERGQPGTRFFTHHHENLTYLNLTYLSSIDQLITILKDFQFESICRVSRIHFIHVSRNVFKLSTLEW